MICVQNRTKFERLITKIKILMIMKKMLVLFACLGMFGMMTAQTSSDATAATEKQMCTKSAAAKAASLDGTVESRVCEKSGNLSYVRKSVCEKSGNVSFSEVKYDSASGKFVNYSPSKGTKASCSKSKAACSKSKAACTKSKKASAIKTSASLDANGKAACTAKQKAACAKKCTAKQKAACAKSKATSTPAKEEGKVKLVSNEG